MPFKNITNLGMPLCKINNKEIGPPVQNKDWVQIRHIFSHEWKWVKKEETNFWCQFC